MPSTVADIVADLESLSEARARPFLKWAGGKRFLVPKLVLRAPNRFGAYHEPFIGGGALFYALRPGRAHLGDANERLARTYRAVRDSRTPDLDPQRDFPS